MMLTGPGPVLAERSSSDVPRIAGYANPEHLVVAFRATFEVIAAATVLLAIFIIAVDCLPVLSKMMSGTTWYDDILEFRLRMAERMAADAMKVTERQATSRGEIELSRIESRVRTEEKHEIYPLVHRK